MFEGSRIQAAVAIALAVPALAGCLGQVGLQPSTAPTNGSGNATDTPDDASTPPADGNETESGNETSSGDDGAGDDDGNETSGGNETGGYGNETSGNETADRSWPAVDQAEIRPGVPILGRDCTANFVFSSPDNATLYIGTASHCVGGMNVGDAVTVAGIDRAGRLAYCSFEHTMDEDGCPETPRVGSQTNDFALVEIRDAHRDKVHPAMLHWGGPTGMATSASLGTQAKTYGNSATRELASPLDPREGVVVARDSDTTEIYVAPPSIPGDSGSPSITADGRAIGTLMGMTTVPAGADTYSNLDRAVAFMEDNTDLEVELKTWSLLASGALPG